MQPQLFGDLFVPPPRAPTISMRKVSADHIAIRFDEVSDRKRFDALLSRFNFEFPLAVFRTIEGRPWWLIAATQESHLVAFARHVGLRVVRER